jgi:protein TonB
MRYGLQDPYSESDQSAKAASLATLVAIAALHVAGLTWLYRIELMAAAQQVASVLNVSLIRDEPVKPPQVPPPPPKPQIKPYEPPPILTTQAQPEAPAVFEAPPPKPEPVAVVPPAPPKAVEAAPAPVLPPDFTATYLENPAPAYPAMSRRMNEQGRVLLRVFVTPAGKADRIEIQRSSGYSRLDDAARNAVQQWRFVPATQSGQPVAAWVVVPLSFSLS